jgi:hypothetical protein
LDVQTVGLGVGMRQHSTPILLRLLRARRQRPGGGRASGSRALETISLNFAATNKPDGEREKDRYDFAIARITDDLLAKLAGVKYVTEAEMSRSVASTEGRFYTCLGYPN